MKNTIYGLSEADYQDFLQFISSNRPDLLPNQIKYFPPESTSNDVAIFSIGLDDDQDFFSRRDLQVDAFEAIYDKTNEKWKRPNTTPANKKVKINLGLMTGVIFKHQLLICYELDDGWYALGGHCTFCLSKVCLQTGYTAKVWIPSPEDYVNFSDDLHRWIPYTVSWRPLLDSAESYPLNASAILLFDDTSQTFRLLDVGCANTFYLSNLEDPTPPEKPIIQIAKNTYVLLYEDDTLELGNVNTGDIREIVLTIRNIGDQNLIVSAINLTQAGTVFSLDDLPSFPETLTPFAEVTFTIIGTAVDGLSEGTIEVISNDTTPASHSPFIFTITIEGD